MHSAAPKAHEHAQLSCRARAARQRRPQQYKLSIAGRPRARLSALRQQYDLEARGPWPERAQTLATLAKSRAAPRRAGLAGYRANATVVAPFCNC